MMQLLLTERNLNLHRLRQTRHINQSLLLRVLLENSTATGPSSCEVPEEVSKFEKQNEMSINVFVFEKEFFPLYISQLDEPIVKVDLLYIKKTGNSHYCLIKDLNRVFGSTKRCQNKYYFCRRCLHGFTQEGLLADHEPYSKQFDFQKAEFSIEGKIAFYI